MTKLTPPPGIAHLSKEEILRYSRHLILPEVTFDGQKKLKAASVLIIGTGGLGAPVSMYLAAAGIGRIGLVDFDTVDFSNLQRQIIFSTSDVGKSKTQTAKERLAGLNPHVEIALHDTRLNSSNAMEIIRGYDIVIDGTDNFPTRYCVNDACVFLNKPNIYGSIFRFEGQATVFDPRLRRTQHAEGVSARAPDTQERGPCYRCLYPEPPPPGMVPSCAEGGVLGVLPGVIGCIQATEAIKLILGQGESLAGRLLRYNALEMSFKIFKLHHDPNCPVCGDKPTITQLIDYEQFCGIRGEESDTIIHQGPIPAINVRELKKRIDSGEEVNLIDVREPAEWAICHIDQAKLIPMGMLPTKLHEFDPHKEYIIQCRSGGRSATAVEFLQKSGIRAFNLTGGILAWGREIDKNMPAY